MGTTIVPPSMPSKARFKNMVQHGLKIFLYVIFILSQKHLAEHSGTNARKRTASRMNKSSITYGHSEERF